MIAGYRPPWLDDELELLGKSARAFFAKQAVPHLERWAQQRVVDRDFWVTSGEAGLLCCSIPEEYGGGGGSYAADLAVLQEQMGAGLIGWGNHVHSGIVAHYLQALGNHAQRLRWLPKLASGEFVGAICMTEPDAGSDLQALRTRAERVRGGWRISGAKTFITNGSNADLFIVVASTSPEKRGKGLTLFVVEAAEAPGLRRGRKLDKIGQPSADTSEIFLDDVVVPGENLLGDLDGAFGHLMGQLPQERLLIGLTAVVTAERAVAETVSYVKERKAFGAPLWDKQHVRMELAECATAAHVGRVFVDSCIQQHLVGGGLDLTASAMLKTWATEMQGSVVDRCLQLHGGYGYMREYPIGQLFVDSRVQRIYGGANEVLKDLVARAL